ncbi:MAG: DegV family protein [Clostridiales bacterium]|jgi:DegV family protein with EDD domain|nr:DegV family protein [Clostridiales bacterium]
MPKFKIISDSSCDLPASVLEENDISLVHYYVTLDGGLHYMKEYKEIMPEAFYDALRTQKSITPKTSLPPIQDYIDAFRPALENGQDVLCVCLTQKFSGSYQSAHNAVNLLKDEFPGRVVRIVDSRSVTISQGILVMQAAQLREKGLPIEDAASIVEALAAESRIIFTVDTLEYLQRGGRIGKVAAFTGTLLNIKPLIYMRDGELNPFSRVRGRHKALHEMVETAARDIGDEALKYTVWLVHADCLDELQAVCNELKQRHNIFPDPRCAVIGATIGTHIGPSAIGIAYILKPEFLKGREPIS